MNNRRKKWIIGVITSFVLLFNWPIAIQAVDMVTIVPWFEMESEEIAPEIEAVSFEESIASEGYFGHEPVSVSENHIDWSKYSQSQIESATVNAIDFSKYGSGYEYAPLSDEEKVVYTRMYDVCMDFISGTADATYMDSRKNYFVGPVDISGLSQQNLTRLISLFFSANPQFYFSDGEDYYTESGNLYFWCYPDFANGKKRALVTNEIFDVVEDCYRLAGINGKTDLQKEVELHDLLCANVSYQKGYFDQSAYSSFIEQKAVCRGYSQAMAILLNGAGIKTISVISQDHSWNKLLLDGKWYALDATWNATGRTYKCFNTSDAEMQSAVSADFHHNEIYGSYTPKADTTMQDRSILRGRMYDNTLVFVIGGDTEEVGKKNPDPKKNTSTNTVTTQDSQNTSKQDQSVVKTETKTEKKEKIPKPTIGFLDSVKNNKKRTVTIEWGYKGRGKDREFDGCQIQYATNRKFTKGVKYKTCTVGKVKIKKLRKNKTYYFRIRLFNEDSKGNRHYSKWSKVKKVRIKK